MYNKLKYVFNRRQKVYLLILTLVIAIGAFVELLGVTAILPFVNAILAPEEMLENPFIQKVYTAVGFSEASQIVFLLGAFIIAIYILKNLYLAFMYNLQYTFIYHNQRKLSGRLMDCYIHQPYVYHLTHNSAELIRNISDDVGMFFATVLAALQLLTEGLVCLALVIYLLLTDLMITLGVTLFAAIFIMLFLKLSRGKLKEYGNCYRRDSANMKQDIMQTFGGIKEIKVCEKENYFIDLYDGHYKKFANAYKKYQLYNILPRPIMETICIIGLMGVVLAKLYMGTDTIYFIPIIAVFAVAAFRMLPSLNRIVQYLGTISFNKVSVDSIYNDLKEVERLSKEKRTVPFTKTIEFHDKITLSNLSFAYPNTDKNVLNGINLDIPKNSSVALVGPSGQGKTTLADIMLGVLKPNEGTVSVDGVNIESNVTAWHEKIGYIPQSIFLIDDTIRKNIAFGYEETEIDEEKLEKALRDAQLSEFIETLEMGVETVIGERGVRLSGGQRQRIGIARALYHNPEVLVLDEATSALDNDTEAAVMDAINKLKGSKTLIIIAHRLSTIENCDIRYEVNNGQVVNVL